MTYFPLIRRFPLLNMMREVILMLRWQKFFCAAVHNWKHITENSYGRETKGYPGVVKITSPAHPFFLLDQRKDYRPQHCLYFLPLPQGHGSLRPTLRFSL